MIDIKFGNFYITLHVYYITLCRYVFDNLSCDQAEDLLWQHGEDGTYLVSHFHDPESYGMSIRVRYVHVSTAK